MARHRSITPDEVLDAAERVAIRDGAAALSIDAVAREAGISKSRVVYDYKSKSGLIEAVFSRRIESEKARIAAAVEDAAGSPHPALFGRIAAATELTPDDERTVLVALAAAMSSEENLQQRMRDWMSEELSAVRAGSARPRAALVAYLALQGFLCTEYCEFHRWTGVERAEILDSIRAVFTSFAEPAAAVASAHPHPERSDPEDLSATTS